MTVHLNFTAVERLVPARLLCIFCFSLGVLFASPSQNAAPSAKFTSSTGLQEGGWSQKTGHGCMSGSLRALSATANREGARKALPSMEREEWCGKYAGRNGSTHRKSEIAVLARHFKNHSFQHNGAKTFMCTLLIRVS